MKFFNLSLVLVLCSLFPAASASFKPWDISEENNLLLTARTRQPGWEAYQTAMIAELDENDSISFLTHFPEYATWHPAANELEILNRFGLFRLIINEKGSEFRRLPVIPGISELGVTEGQILASSPSPNGRWVLIQEVTGPIRGNLVLVDMQNTGSQTRMLVSRNHIFEYYSDSEENFRNTKTRVEKYSTSCGLWSPDSRYVLYSNGGQLYYLSVHSINTLPIDSFGNVKIPDESFRRFGQGNLNSVRWINDNSVYGIFDSLVVRFRPAELPMLSWYSTPLPNSSIIGRLPVEFNPNFDKFWPSPDGKSILVLKNGQSLFRFPLTGENENALPFTMPFLTLPGNRTVLQLWWRNNGDILLLVGGSRRWKPSAIANKSGNEAGLSESQLYMFRSESKSDMRFTATDIIDLHRFVPSPDGSVIAILRKDGIDLLKTENLNKIGTSIEHSNPRDLLWTHKYRVIILGEYNMVSVNLKSREQFLIGLSQVDRIGYDETGNILAFSNESQYIWDNKVQTWRKNTQNFTLRSATLTSPSYRVYTTLLSTSSYDNQIMIRTVDGFGNRELLTIPPTRTRLLPNADDKLQSAYDPRVFDHGSRLKSRQETALVFNAIDNDTGLGEILNILADYDIRATFFVGGDFIRQNPESTRLLASSNNEIGSLFYTHLDMSDYRYRIDEDFVIRGLGRNEDEYYKVTGAELVTLWHAPWYVVSAAVMDASDSMNYLYVGRDVDPLDWVTLEAPKGTRDLYKQSAFLVEQVLDEVQPGSIIPIRIGKPGNREDYFFQKLDLLINALLREGYTIVPAGMLKEHSQ